MDDAGWAKYLKDLAETVRDTARINRETARIQQEFAFLRDVPRERADHQTASHRGPSNPMHQTWREFVLDLQQLEARARQQNRKLTKANVCDLGTDTLRTVTRTMVWYGLSPRDWPPSKWDPDEPRQGGAGARN